MEQPPYHECATMGQSEHLQYQQPCIPKSILLFSPLADPASHPTRLLPAAAPTSTHRPSAARRRHVLLTVSLFSLKQAAIPLPSHNTLAASTPIVAASHHISITSHIPNKKQMPLTHKLEQQWRRQREASLAAAARAVHWISICCFSKYSTATAAAAAAIQYT